MRRVTVFCLALLALAAGAGTARAQSLEPAGPSSKVLVLKVDGSIDGTMASYLRDGIADAEGDGSIVVVQLDTAGTLDQDAIALAQRIHDATVPVVVWVGPTPAKASGAGLLFLYAASLGAVAPGAGIGPLEPIDLIGARNSTLPGVETLAGIAGRWVAHRSGGQAVPVEFPTTEIAAQPALDRDIVQVAAASITDLLDRLDGRTLATASGAVPVHTKVAESRSQQPVDVRFTSLGPVDRVLHAAASPAAIYVLLVAGLAALAFELTQPGFGFAGFAGVAMLALGIYGLTAVPASWLGLSLLVLGIASMTADVRLRRLGALTGIGIVVFASGSLLAFRDVAPAIRISPWLIGSFAVASFLYYGFALTVAIQSRERITSSQRGLVGLVGEARGELKPEGPVYVKGTLWRGRSADGPIPAGTRIRVRGVDGLILRVEPDPGADPPQA